MSISQVPDAVLAANTFPFLTTSEVANIAPVSKQMNRTSSLDIVWKNREPSHKEPKQPNHSWKRHVTLVHDPYFQIMKKAKEQQHNYVAKASAIGSSTLQILGMKNYYDLASLLPNKLSCFDLYPYATHREIERTFALCTHTAKTQYVANITSLLKTIHCALKLVFCPKEDYPFINDGDSIFFDRHDEVTWLRSSNFYIWSDLLEKSPTSKPCGFLWESSRYREMLSRPFLDQHFQSLLACQKSHDAELSSSEATYEAAKASCLSHRALIENRTNLGLWTGGFCLTIAAPLAIANYQWDKNQTDTPLRRQANLVGGAALIAIGALSNFAGGDETASGLCISSGACFVIKGIIPPSMLQQTCGKVVGTVRAAGFWAFSKGKSLAVGLKRKLFG